jgi:hypothetical protein
LADATYATAYIGVSTDAKPTGVAIGSIFYETDTHQKHITADGANWIEMQDLDAVVLGAGTAFIGRVGIDQTTPGTTNAVAVMSTTVTKTVQMPLLAYTAIAANAQQESSELALTNIKKVTLFIEHARDSANAFVGAGTEYRILGSSKAAGSNGWFPVFSIVADIAAATGIATDAEEAVASTRIECGAVVPVKGDYVFFKNGTLANSEMSKVVAVDATGAAEYFDILHGLTNIQAAGSYYNKGEKYTITLNVEGLIRMKVVVNNNNGTTNQAIVSKVEAIIQS